jgi:hypothetical protein
VFINFNKLVENFFNGGEEFICVQKLLISTSVAYRQTYPHTHHQNGSVERKLRHIVDTSLALLAHSHAPSNFGMMHLIQLAI